MADESASAIRQFLSGSPANGEMTLFVGFQFLVDPARRAQVIVEDVRGGPPRDFGRMATERIRELALVKGRIGIVEVDAGSMPADDLALFAEELPNAQFDFVTDDWWRQGEADQECRGNPVHGEGCRDWGQSR